ncbi:MAG: ABC-2 family transporter protein [Clostridia bacterium]|nr:ABC-2 family transporter protein [Clostridia bacterium]
MLYNKYVKMHSKSALQFKANLAMLSFASVLISIGEILSIFLLFKRFESVGYWGFYEAALMFGIITTVYSIVECFGRGFDEFANLIKRGDLDRLMVRPVNIVYQIFGSKIEFSKLSRVLLGLIVSVIAIINLSITWTFTKIIVLTLTYICGCCVILGVMMIGAGISVFSVENLEFINIITNGAKEIGFYPINIYNKLLSRIFTFIIPVACFNYLPLSYIMGYGNLPQIVYALSPLIGMLFVIPCLLFFLWSLKKYQSTGT